MPAAPEGVPDAVPVGVVVHAPLSLADLLDRITILEVKAERIRDAGRQANVLRELALLRQARDGAGLPWAEAAGLEAELRALHARLWDAEDLFRGLDARGEHGPAFVATAREVIVLNARRAEVKRAINTALGSGLVEEKFYGAGEAGS